MKVSLLKLSLVLFLCVGAGYVGIKLFGSRDGDGLINGLVKPRIDEKVTLSLLRSEAMSFLVTRRNVTQLVVEHRESDLLGRWHALRWATVKWNWGVDMKLLTENDLRREGDTVLCRLPEPSLLDFSVVSEDGGFVSRSTLVPKLKEIFDSGQQRAKLDSLLYKRAMQFADEQKLRPSRQEMVDQLNRTTDIIRQTTGIEVRFE